MLDDHPLLRAGLSLLLQGQADLCIPDAVATADEALARIAVRAPDVVVADLSPEGRTGMEFLCDLRTAHPAVPVLVLSMHDETLYAERLLRAERGAT